MQRAPWTARALRLGLALLLLGLVVEPLLLVPQVHAQSRRRHRKPPKKVAVEVLCFVEAASVVLDGEHVGKTPLEAPLLLMPGEHTLRVSKRGYADFFDTFTVKRRAISIEADLLAISGIVFIESSPSSAQVIIDGSFVGETPFDSDVEDGDRALTLKLAGFHDHEQLVRIIAGQSYDMNIQMQRLPPPAEPFYTAWWFWTGVGVVVVGATVATVALTGSEPQMMGPVYPQIVLP